MRTYLVGGAVRDELLGTRSEDADWVVTGCGSEELEALGYQRVGRDFPVFLHPETRQEHALPRRSSSPVAPANEDADLWADLYARDLTVNAMAKDSDGRLIDPWGGLADVHNRVLRHVSSHFAEDPIRILRVARFQARLAVDGFSVAPETLSFMTEMVARGELDAIAPERVWKEVSRALLTPRPSEFLRTLRACGALAKILPEVDRLYGIPQPPAHHPEIDTGIHIEMCLDVAARDHAPLPVCLAVLLHDLGKGITPRNEWPRHFGHEQAGVPLVKEACRRMRVPQDLEALACAVCDSHLRVHRAAELKASTTVDLLSGLRAFRDPIFFEHALWACRCDAQGRTGYEQRPYPSMDILRAAREASCSVTAQMVMREGLEGPAIGEALRGARILRLHQMRRQASMDVGPAMKLP